MFAELCSHIIECHRMNKIVYLGGDLNCRPGNLNNISRDKSWSYTDNIDLKNNSHGRNFFPELCKVANIMPVNHLKYNNKKFPGDFTYIKSEKKSQIDFVLTDKNGRKYLQEFNVVQDNWHLTDHKPIEVKLLLNIDIDVMTLFTRASELNYDITSTKYTLPRYNKKYNYDKIESFLVDNSEVINTSITNYLDANDIDNAMVTLDNFLQCAHKAPGARLQKQPQKKRNVGNMVNVNKNFNDYRNALNSQADDEIIENALNKYISDRKKLHFTVLKDESDLWKEAIQSTDAKSVWSKIDWNGHYTSQKPTQHPSVDEFETYFAELYDCKDDEIDDISHLQSNVSIPILDEPIVLGEVQNSIKDMKNGGFDFSLPILSILFKHFSATLLFILNFLLFVKYPIHLALSILCVIPKKGNLRMPKNFRGIQMMRAIACLFDRIVARRLYVWMKIEPEQSAFQKGKSTVIPIFTLRLLIEICIKKKIPLYIAFVDLEKAFDKVSRYLLLAKLVSLGIGHIMLEALKRMYSHTLCILCFYGCFSDIFVTKSGIRQGSASSVLLFILFMDGLFIFLRNTCTIEDVINEFHALVHADDTLLISTERTLFINKCNAMMEYFQVNKLTLNLSKSSYLIINPTHVDCRNTITLKKGYLEYKAIQLYLGVIVSDDGKLVKDVKEHIISKKGSIMIKFTNFCVKNYLAPLNTKLSVIDACVVSSLCYASETWGNNGKEVEVLYRYGLRTALGVRQSVSNEITYIESNKFPLKCRVLSQQLKFWIAVQVYLEKHPDSLLNCLIKQAQELDIQYYKHYVMLQTKYETPDNCRKVIESEYMTTWKNKFEASLDDVDSKLETYYRINPTLQSDTTNIMLETDRILLTRFRCGSHSLKLELGRFSKPRIPREQRLCKCKQGVQTIWHCFMECTLTYGHIQGNYCDLESIFKDEDVCHKLLLICKILKVPF